jgi:acetyltransferase-like isoleucine patch superfamily enzyme
MPFGINRVLRLLRRPWADQLNSWRALIVSLKTILYYRRVFGRVGRGTLVYSPMLLSNPRFVFIGERTLIRQGARIEAIVLDERNPPRIVIGSNVNIEQNCHLVCSSKIEIGNNVTITGQCAIVDTAHPFEDVIDPGKVGERINTRPTPVSIGDGSFLGFGSVILPGVSIGKKCVIGANSTVTRDVPDFCVAAGNPARVIKSFDWTTKTWVSHRDSVPSRRDDCV